MSKPRYFIVYYNDGYQASVSAKDESTALHVGDKFERHYRSLDPSRKIRKAVRVSEMSDVPAIRQMQSLRIVENNRALLNKPARLPSKRSERRK